MALTNHFHEGLRQMDAERRVYAIALLPIHLADAQLYDQLYSLLTDFQFMSAKVAQLGVHPLIDDYALCPNDIPEMQLLKQALQLSAHNVNRDRIQLASQLVGRLLGSKNGQISRILGQITETTRGPWLRPLTSSLSKPGGALLATLTGHGGPICAIAVTPDSQNIISAAEDSTIRIWDRVSGELVRTLRSGDTSDLYQVESLRVTPDGDRLITVSGQNGRFAVWDLKKGTVLSRRSVGRAISVTPDGHRLIHMDVIWDRFKPKPAHFVDLATGAEWDVGDFTDRRALALSADGTRVIVVAGNTLEMWDVERRVLSRTFKGHKLSATSLAVTPDWRYAVSCAWDSNLIVWDVERGTKIHVMTVEKDHGAWLLVITRDGHRAISATQGVPLTLWDLERGAELYSSGKASSFTEVALSPDERRALIGSDNTISILNLNSGFESSILGKHSSHVTALAVAPDGLYAVSGSHDMTLRVWDLASRNQVSGAGKEPTKAISICVSGNGSRAMVLREDSRAEIWSLNEGREETIPSSLEVLQPAVLTADGQQIVFASNDGTLHVFDIDGGVVQHVMRGHEDQVIALMAATGPGRVISGSKDGTIRVWDTRRGLEVGAVRSVGGRPSSIRLLSGVPLLADPSISLRPSSRRGKHRSSGLNVLIRLSDSFAFPLGADADALLVPLQRSVQYLESGIAVSRIPCPLPSFL